jgi:hypothetical protein
MLKSISKYLVFVLFSLFFSCQKKLAQFQPRTSENFKIEKIVSKLELKHKTEDIINTESNIVKENSVFNLDEEKVFDETKIKPLIKIKPINALRNKKIRKEISKIKNSKISNDSKSDTKGKVSLILGILGVLSLFGILTVSPVFLFISFFSGILALIFGLLAKKETTANPKNRKAGIILGIISILLSISVVAIAVLALAAWARG